MFDNVRQTTAAATGDDVARVLADVVQRLSALAGAVGEAASWSAEARSVVLSRLDAVSSAVGLVRAPVVLAERDAGTSQRVGDRSFEAAVARVSGKGVVEAAREVRQAETLTAMPALAAAVGSGGMTLAHVDAVAKVAAGASGGAAAGVLGSEAGQAAVLELARGRDAGQFAKDLARYVAAQDPAAHEHDHATQRAERFLVLSDQANGTFLKGRLDRFAGERLRLALEATGCEPDQDRDRGQAMADALVALADGALTGAGSGASASQRRPHVSLLLREDTYAALLSDQRNRARAGSPTIDRATDPVTAAPAAISESGLPVSRNEVARILCDATVARIVVDAHDVPLSVGRDSRLYTGTQRRAVIARDKQCAWPGCGIPARWAEVHHIRWWARDQGETSVENGVLLCEHHHHVVHQHDLVIVRHLPTAGGPRRLRADEPPDAVAPGVHYSFRTRSGRLVAPAPRAAAVSVPPPRPVAVAAPAVDRPGPSGPTPTGPATRAMGGSASRPAGVNRRAVQPSFLDELIAAQPPDPPF